LTAIGAWPTHCTAAWVEGCLPVNAHNKSVRPACLPVRRTRSSPPCCVLVRAVCTGMPEFQEQFEPEFLGWDPACADRTRVTGWCYGTCGDGYTGQPRIACASPSPGNSGWQPTAIIGKCVKANVCEYLRTILYRTLETVQHTEEGKGPQLQEAPCLPRTQAHCAWFRTTACTALLGTSAHIWLHAAAAQHTAHSSMMPRQHTRLPEH
jgi:hypothetical protein